MRILLAVERKVHLQAGERMIALKWQSLEDPEVQYHEVLTFDGTPREFALAQAFYEAMLASNEAVLEPWESAV